MSARDLRVLLREAAAACDAIASFIEGRELANYDQDLMLRSAVERQFEIIGESLRKAIDLEPSIATSIEHARQIIGFRNNLAHGYESVTNTVVWGIATSHLPRLRAQAQALLDARS